MSSVEVRSDSNRIYRSEGVDLLYNVLNKHKFVIYIPREVFEKNRLRDSNPHLKIYK